MRPPPLKALRYTLLMWAFAWVAAAAEPGFTVLSAVTREVDEVYQLDARIDYTLSTDAREALTNGVPLTLRLDIEILRPRPLMWDEVVASLNVRYRLSYHALSRRYLVENRASGAQHSYNTLYQALTALGTIRALPVLDKRLLEVGQVYDARLRVVLDREDLPAPLRLMAYFSRAWTLNSPWFRWSLAS